MNQELQQFAYVASHDLQEPLRKIISFAELLENDLAQRDGSPNLYVQKISEAAKRMSSLVKDLLAFSKLAQKNVPYEMVELNTILGNVKNDFELLISQKNATVAWDPLPVIEAVPLQMNQLFYNIISNALKFTTTKRQPTITIREVPFADRIFKRFPSFENVTDYVCIECLDNGIGFDEKYSEQIFAMFQRLHNRVDFKGSGIGLALCKKIASNHHGQIFATSTEGEGSAFYIILPRKQGDDVASDNSST
jgi:light-regulated signal transduction histidine kinase (bacteriophytochrome)